jgi:hypothetical protein
MAELPGYNQPVSIGSYSGAPAYARPRQYSPVEKQIIQQKGEELRDAGIIAKIPWTTPLQRGRPLQQRRMLRRVSGRITGSVSTTSGRIRTLCPFPMPYHYRRRFFAVLARPGTSAR